MTNFTSTNTGIVLDNAATEDPSTLLSGHYVTNTTTLHNGDAVYGSNAAAWNFTNYGTIAGTGADSNGVRLIAGGTVANGSSGRQAHRSEATSVA